MGESTWNPRLRLKQYPEEWSSQNTMVITWVKALGLSLPDAYEPELIPDVGELDELETFVGSRRTKSGSGQR